MQENTQQMRRKRKRSSIFVTKGRERKKSGKMTQMDDVFGGSAASVHKKEMRKKTHLINIPNRSRYLKFKSAKGRLSCQSVDGGVLSSAMLSLSDGYVDRDASFSQFFLGMCVVSRLRTLNGSWDIPCWYFFFVAIGFYLGAADQRTEKVFRSLCRRCERNINVNEFIHENIRKRGK